jgi:hypothetical protein
MTKRMPALDRLGDLLAEDAQHRRPDRLHDSDVAAERQRRAGHLAADEAAADHHDVRPGQTLDRDGGGAGRARRAPRRGGGPVAGG